MPWFRKTSLYLDYMASTPVDSAVLLLMNKVARQTYANPHATHSAGLAADQIIQASAEAIAKIIKATPTAIHFTSGATESNSLALLGVIKNYKKKYPKSRPHIILSRIEHPSVEGLKKLQDDLGIVVDFVDIDNEGIVNLSELFDLIKPETILISVMMVNSEIGTIQPIAEISRLIRRWRKQNDQLDNSYPLLHTDASQAVLSEDINVLKLHADILTLNPHKFYGPNGIGLLYISPLIKDMISPILISGYEDPILRPGTPATALIAGAAKALELAAKNQADFVQKTTDLFDYLIPKLKDLGGEINGSINPQKRVRHNISVTFPAINHEFLQMQLDADHIYCATKSACLENDHEGSMVIKSLGGSHNSALRISLGRDTTKKDLDRLCRSIRTSLAIQRSVQNK